MIIVTNNSYIFPAKTNPIAAVSVFDTTVEHNRNTMDMDSEMDILPEELELLESNYQLLEQDQQDYYPYIDETQPQPQPQSPKLVDLTVPSQPQTNGYKRSRSNSPHDVSLPVPSDGKRVRVCDSSVAAEAEEEDWIRYSPPPVATEEVRFVKEKTVSRYASEIEGECMPITAPGGDRVYAKMDRFAGEERLKKLDCSGYGADLSSEPIGVLLERLEQEAFTKTLEASSECQSVLEVPDTRVVHEQLWVDKYAPKSFTELLSDEQTNREVLLWLKQWDSNVFGSEIRSTSDDVLSALKRHSSIAQNQKPFDSKFPRINRGSKWSSDKYRNARSVDDSGNSKSTQDTWNTKSRSTGPPEQKILLLCGPPGLGKTTLAHVAARHCGYLAVEVNASDDRSASTIETKILDVVQMNSVLSSSRPKCLVVDEIDGALGDGKGAVEVLLKMISAEKKPDGGKQSLGKEQQGRKSSKKGRKTASLSRPVICICNDLYAPALRPLRQVAKVHIFVQPTVSRVVSSHAPFDLLNGLCRLKYICNKEGMNASAIALTALAEYTECDIRSCLNTLQFISKKNETLNAFDVGSQVVGQKDMSKNVIDIWKEIFQRKRMKMERTSHRSKSFEFGSLYSLVSYRGDYDLIMDGIHENILQLNFHDPVMQKTVKCFNSLEVYDIMHQYIMRTHRMSLNVYLPPVAITVHNIVAQVALQLLSDKEKNDLNQLVSTMVSYAITYKAKKSDMLLNNLRHEVADDLVMSLVPPISDFINFQGYTSNHYVLSLAMKQVERHKILQYNDKTMALANGGHEVIDAGTKNFQLANSNHAAVVDVKTVQNQNVLSKQLNANPTTVSRNFNSSEVVTDNSRLLNKGNRKNPFSFFARGKKSNAEGFQSNDGSLQKESASKKDQFPLLFKFNEGFTNAVKRPVRIREFLS
ncbi:hypothetical protein Lal_00034862 [Lupinus albus]|nr:hypothetical protein Lal_00034862 [Lupinus albus]